MVLQHPIPFAPASIMNAYWLDQAQIQGLEALGLPQHPSCHVPTQRSVSPASKLGAEKMFLPATSAGAWSPSRPVPGAASDQLTITPVEVST